MEEESEDISDIRSLAEVQKILGHAKLDSQELQSSIQCLSFVPDLDNQAVHLMEVDDGILKELKAGDSMVIRGGKNDSAVICSKDRTYSIRMAETSNCLLLLPECSIPSGKLPMSESEDLTLVHRQVCAVKQEYYELRRMRPRLRRLQQMLKKNVYSGWECEKDEDHQGTKYTFKDLQSSIQASEEELLKGLGDIKACHIDGHWRMLDFDFIGQVLQSILSLQDEQSWGLDAIPEALCCEILEELYLRETIKLVLQSFSDDQPATKDSESNSDINYRLSEDKVCRYYAEMLLRPVEKFQLQDFENTWQLAVPEGMTTGMYQLEGLALIDRSSKPQVIHYYPISDLSEDVEERFNTLFRTREKWTLEEITPYIRGVVEEKSSVGALLMKHARASTQNGIRVYNSKRPLRDY